MEQEIISEDWTGSLAWSGDLLVTGSRDKNIWLFDIR